MSTAYLAGPMRGLPYFNFPAFDAAAAKLRADGWTIHSPAEKDRDVLDVNLCPDGTDEELAQQDFSLAGALAWDFARIMESSCVIALPGWEHSTGVHWEMTVAHALGKPVFQYPDLTPVELPEVVTQPVAVQRAHVPQAVWDARMKAGEERSYAHLRGVDGPGAWKRVAVSVPGDGHLTHSHPEQPEVHVHEHPLTADEIRVTDPTTGGQKGQKATQMSAIDPLALDALGRVAGMGAEKYERLNYLKGFDWHLALDALHRHVLQFEAGESVDPESGICHMAHAAWQALCLVSFYERGIGNDDRIGPR